MVKCVECVPNDTAIRSARGLFIMKNALTALHWKGIVFEDMDFTAKIAIILLLTFCIPVESSPPHFPATELYEARDLLIFYARCGITYKVISKVLEKYHGISISENGIRKRLKRYGEPSRHGRSDVLDNNDLLRLIKERLKLLPMTVGYRQMTGVLKHEGYNVRRDQVMNVMRQADPDGVYFRRRHCLQRRTYVSSGPNRTWHIDGYDILKPYGFPIHGCIDGYSRKIMWLAVCPSNNDPRQVAYLYMTCVRNLNGVPKRIQGDRGTENTVIGALQCIFREGSADCDQLQCFQHIASQLNQRIESWWSVFRKRTAQWWIDFFKDLVDSGNYKTYDNYAVKCMRYCFLPLIQKDLDDIVEQWNNHHISVSRNSGSPNGRPNILFSFPELSAGKENMYPVNDENIIFGFEQTTKPCISGDQQFDDFAFETSARLGWKIPTTWKEALQQYFQLLDLL